MTFPIQNDANAPVAVTRVLCGQSLRRGNHRPIPFGADRLVVQCRAGYLDELAVSGPEIYSDQDMLSTHRGMNISEQEFISVIDDAMGALEKNRIDAPTRNDVLAVLWSLKGEVIRVRRGAAKSGRRLRPRSTALRTRIGKIDVQLAPCAWRTPTHAGHG